jgi:hypothetical protein
MEFEMMGIGSSGNQGLGKGDRGRGEDGLNPAGKGNEVPYE